MPLSNSRSPSSTVDRAVKRRADRAVGPLAIPATVALTLANQPFDNGRDVDPEISAIGHGPAVDALLDFALPVGLAVVIPSRVGADQFDCPASALRSGIEAELPKLRQGKARSRPRLADLLPLTTREIVGKERTAGPLAVRVLVGEQPCSPALDLHPGPLRLPCRFRRVGKVAHHLPTDRWVGVEKPFDRRVGAGHVRASLAIRTDGCLVHRAIGLEAQCEAQRRRLPLPSVVPGTQLSLLTIWQFI